MNAVTIMSKYADLVASIAANPAAHAVNREEKMERTIQQMVSNMEKEAAKHERMNAAFTNTRGYGEGRKMGD
jgi:hypothetical protein